MTTVLLMHLSGLSSSEIAISRRFLNHTVGVCFVRFNRISALAKECEDCPCEKSDGYYKANDQSGCFACCEVLMLRRR